MSQIATRPPTIAMVVNDPRLFEGQYERYMMNQLREALPYSEVPIRLVLKARKRTPLEVLKGRVEAGVEAEE